jgi:hypothetical protein
MGAIWIVGSSTVIFSDSKNRCGARTTARRPSDLRGSIRKQNYIASEILLSETQADLDKAEKKIAELETRNAALLKELAGKTVVDLPPRRK